MVQPAVEDEEIEHEKANYGRPERLDHQLLDEVGDLETAAELSQRLAHAVVALLVVGPEQFVARDRVLSLFSGDKQLRELAQVVHLSRLRLVLAAIPRRVIVIILTIV